MATRFSIFMERRRQVGAARRALNEIPYLPCTSETLRKITSADLSAIFTSTEIDHEWATAQENLMRAGTIEDGKTDGVNPGDRRVIWYLIKSLGATSVLEIGTHVGASTLHIASAMRSMSERDPLLKPRLITVDIHDVNSAESGAWKQKGLAASPREMIGAIGCEQLVSFVTEPSLTFLDRCQDRFDFIFLDGDHFAPSVYQEIPRALKLLKPNGVILLHDYFPGNKPLWSNGVVVPGPNLAVTRLRNEKAPIKAIPVGEVPWQTKLGSRITSLAVLTRDR